MKRSAKLQPGLMSSYSPEDAGWLELKKETNGTIHYINNYLALSLSGNPRMVKLNINSEKNKNKKNRDVDIIVEVISILTQLNTLSSTPLIPIHMYYSSQAQSVYSECAFKDQSAV